MSFGLPYGAKKRNEKGELRSINTVNGERFVYYERLLTDYEKGIRTGFIPPERGKQVYEKANRVWDWRADYGGSSSNIAEYFSDLAKVEFEKEKALLETHFKTSYDPMSENCGKALIEAYNSILSTKEIFERNTLLLANTNQTTLITHFPDYFDKAFQEIVVEDKTGQIQKEIEDKVVEFIEKDGLEFIDDASFEKALDEVYNNHMPDIVAMALDLMFNAKAENGLKKLGKDKYDELSRAYLEIAQALKELYKKGQANEFIQGMIKNYKLDNFIESATTNSKTNEKTQLTKENYKSALGNFKLSVKLGGKKNPLGGGASELLAAFMAQAIGKMKPTNGVSVQSVHTGDSGGFVKQKVDAMILIGYNPGAAEAAERKLKNFMGEGRGTNIEDLQRFQREMFEEFGNGNGFMIYINSKNYTPNWHFRNGYFDKQGNQVSLGGYSAGSPINLETWDDMMHAMNVRGRDFIFTILQLIPGAIAAKRENKEKVSDMFARAISSALFDDFEPADPYDKKTSQQVVHLLWLNGVYIPLSVFYTLLAEAFAEFKDSLKKKELVEVTFKLPDSILYEKQEDQNGVYKPWNVQSHAALAETTVSYHFLSGFQRFMQRFYDFNN